MEKSKSSKRITLIVGLGRFGSSVAKTLNAAGEDILCVDEEPKLVQYWSAEFPCVEANLADKNALAQIGVDEFDAAVVAIGSDIEASVLIAGNLLDSGIEDVWAKATSTEHARILERIGTHHIVNPEADAGNRVGHLISGKMLDYIQVDEDFIIVKMKAPKDIQGFRLKESRIRTKYGITVLGTKTNGQEIERATPETRIIKGDTLVMGGSPSDIEKFVARN